MTMWLRGLERLNMANLVVLTCWCHATCSHACNCCPSQWDPRVDVLVNLWTVDQGTGQRSGYTGPIKNPNKSQVSRVSVAMSLQLHDTAPSHRHNAAGPEWIGICRKSRGAASDPWSCLVRLLTCLLATSRARDSAWARELQYGVVLDLAISFFFGNLQKLHLASMAMWSPCLQLLYTCPGAKTTTSMTHRLYPPIG